MSSVDWTRTSNTARVDPGEKIFCKKQDVLSLICYQSQGSMLDISLIYAASSLCRVLYPIKAFYSQCVRLKIGHASFGSPVSNIVRR